LGNFSLVKNWSEMMRKFWSQNLLLLRSALSSSVNNHPHQKSARIRWVRGKTNAWLNLVN
jgi:hypothetical protein